MDQINLISDMNGERIDRFLSGNLEDLFPFLYTETYERRPDPRKRETGKGKL